jgi:ubiquinone/menaquinone biosynthesis C-methylase UbiE
MSRLLQWIDKQRANRVAAILDPHVRGKTLDVGCWNGAVARRLTQAEVIGIDVVRPPEPQIDVVEFDGVHVPFADKQFETVLCCTALHHAAEPDVLLDEMKRVGRRLVILEDSYDTHCERASVVALHAIGSRMVKIPYRCDGFRSSEAWRRMFADHALAVESSTRHPGVQPGWPFLRHNLFVLRP